MLTQDQGQALLADSNQSNNRTQNSKFNLNPEPSIVTSENEKKSKTKKEKKKRRSRDETQFTSILKIFNIFVGLIVVAFGVVCYTFFKDYTPKQNFVGFILPGYIAVSGFLILLIELNIGFIIRNMRFLYNYFGRGIFNIYVGVMPLCLIVDDKTNPQDQTFQIIIIVMVSLMCLIGVLYILAKIFCCAKEENKRKKRRKYSSSSESSSDSD